MKLLNIITDKDLEDQDILSLIKCITDEDPYTVINAWKTTKQPSTIYMTMVCPWIAVCKVVLNKDKDKYTSIMLDFYLNDEAMEMDDMYPDNGLCIAVHTAIIYRVIDLYLRSFKLDKNPEIFKGTEVLYKIHDTFRNPKEYESSLGVRTYMREGAIEPLLPSHLNDETIVSELTNLMKQRYPDISEYGCRALLKVFTATSIPKYLILGIGSEGRIKTLYSTAIDFNENNMIDIKILRLNKQGHLKKLTEEDDSVSYLTSVMAAKVINYWSNTVIVQTSQTIQL